MIPSNHIRTMSVPRREIIKLCNVIAQNNNLKTTVKFSVEGALVTGLGALVGGLLGGPRGLAIGGATAAVAAGLATAGQYKSVIEVINEDLTEEQRAQLADAVWGVLRRFDANLLVGGASLVLLANNTSIEKAVIDTMQIFLNNTLDMSIN